MSTLQVRDNPMSGGTKGYSALDDAEKHARRLSEITEQALSLINSSAHSGHFYEEAGNLIHEAPIVLENLRRSLSDLRQDGLLIASVEDAVRRAYSKPVEDLAGYQTVVREDEGKGDVDRTPERALPQTPSKGDGQTTKGPNKPRYNTPSGWEGFPTPGRAPATRGEDYGTPWKNTPLLTRRVDETDYNNHKSAAWEAVQKAVGEVFG